MHRHQRLFLLLFLALMLGVAACGGSSSTATSPTPTSSTSGSQCGASAGLPANVSNHGTSTASGKQLSIEADDFFFQPTCVTGVPAGTVTLMVHNGGQALHNISIPASHLDRDVAPGQTITVQVPIGTAPLAYFCKYHKGVGMYGALLPSGGSLSLGSASGCAGCCCQAGSGS